MLLGEIREVLASCNVNAYMKVAEAILCLYMISTVIIKEISIGN